MAKIETEAARAVRRVREEKELARRQRELNRKRPKFYLWYLLIVLSIVYIVDEVSSNMGTFMKSEVVTEFFIKGRGMDLKTGTALLDTMSAPLYATMIIMPFYKALADRFGRKPFLVINTIGMGVGLAVCLVARAPIVYLLGMLIVNFFMYNDIQVVYVMENAPEGSRAKLTSATKSVALLGVVLIPVLRDLFMGNDGSQWRKVFLIPAIMGIVVGLAAMFLMRETPAFLEKRVGYLRMTDEERQLQAQEKKKADDESKGGVGRALKFMFRHKQIRAVALCGMVFAVATGVTSQYETIMKDAGMQTADITQVMYFNTVTYALITAVTGFVIDGLGRKKSAVLLSILAFLGLTAFVFSAQLGLPAAAIGISYGLFQGGLWSVSDMLCLLISGESSPTHLRASVMATMSLVLGLGTALSNVVIIVGMLFVKSIGMLALCVSAPFMLLSIIILITKVHETKDVDLATVTGEEWD